MRSFILLSATVGLAAATQWSNGCYSKTTAALAASSEYTDTFMSRGLCDNECRESKAFAMVGFSCFCADSVPAATDKVEDAKCDSPCPGYPDDICMCSPTSWKMINADDDKVDPRIRCL
jgi:cell wall integrity and stress response component